MKTTNELENTTNELYDFFGMQPEEDIRDFRITEFNEAYVKKMNAATTPESKAEVKRNYDILYKHVVERLKNYVKPEENFTMVTLLDEHVASLKKGSSNYRPV